MSNDDTSITNELKEKLKLNKTNNKPITNIIFIGHVDAGKSTICGRILVDLNMIDTRTLEKYKEEASDQNRASWYLSWCMDIIPEERDKGKTQELGVSNSLELENVTVNILDAPGHKQYIDCMIDGASRADVGILIVSARVNEFESGFSKGGNTKEHLRLLKAGNCNKLVVLINKMDECNWDSERYLTIKNKLSKFITPIYKNEKVEYIPVSGFDGDNILNKKTTSFYDGPSFLKYLDNLKLDRTNDNLGNEDAKNGLLNKNYETSIITIVEKLKTANNTVLFAKVERGKIHKNKQYAILPYNGKTDKIINIINDDDVDIDIEETCVRNTYKIRLSKCSDDLTNGQKLVYPPEKHLIYKSASAFIAEIGVYDINTAMTIGYTSIIHCNLQMVTGKINGLYDFNTKKGIKVVRKGQRALAKISLDAPIVFRCDKAYKDRFSMRNEDLTIGVGQIVKAITKKKI